MSRKVILRFVFVLSLALAGLAAFLGLMTSGQEQVYAAPAQSVSEDVFAPLDGPANVEGPSAPAAPQASGDVYCVDPLSGTFAPTCTLFFTNVQAAVDAATGGETIKVAVGTYTDTDGDGAVVSVTKSVTLTGGYISPTWTTSDPVANPTILDGEGAVQVVYITAPASIVEGFHICNGFVAPGPTSRGGGVRIDEVASGGVTLGNNHIYSNTASYGGGVFLRHSSSITLSGNTIYSNTAVNGGGVYMYTVSDAILSGNVFLNNTGSAVGGAIRMSMSAARLDNNVIADNQAVAFASGVQVEAGSTINLRHNTIARNTGGDGSGIRIVSNGIAVLTNTILVSHTVGITVPNGTATLVATLWGTDTWANTTDWGGAGTISTGTINVWDYPDFVDADYHIGAGSAAIDRGVDAGVYIDRDGIVRPQGGFDLGAYEVPTVLSLNKIVDVPNPDPGQRITYTIVVTSSGGGATNVLITDTWEPAGALTIAGPIVLDPASAGVTGTFPYTLAHGVTITAGESVTVTFPVTVNAAGGTIITNSATANSNEDIVSDAHVLTTTAAALPEPAWEKLVYVNGIFTDTDPITVTTGDTVTIVDRVWVTHTAPVTFTLVETWTNSLELADWISTTGSTVSSTDSLTWMAAGVANNMWHILTKTFDVVGGTVFDYVTETLEVEDAASQLPDQVLTFYNAGICTPVSIDDLISDSPVEVGDPMNFAATVSGDAPITYTWDFGGLGSGSDTDGATPTYTYTTAGAYTVTLDVENGCPSTDTDFIIVTVNPPPPPPEPDWDKEVYINGVFTDTFPAPVLIGDMVEVVDWVWITHTAPVTFTLVETWTNSLELLGWISDTGSVATTTNSLTWDVGDVAPDTWYAITKTFLVTTTGWTFDYITETLDVEDGAPVAPWVLTFLHDCEPVTSVDFDWSPTDPEPGDVVTFTASSLPSYATPPIAYSWDISGLVTLNGNPVYFTFPTSDTYTVTVSASSPCGGPVVSWTESVAVSGTTPFTPSYGVLLDPPTDTLAEAQGNDVVYHLWITNTGNVADLFDLSWAGDTWATNVTPLAVNLPPSGTAPVTVTVTVANTTDCSDSDTVTITATSQLSPTVSDSSVLTTSIVPSYTVTIEPAMDASSGVPGEDVVYTMRVTNTGICDGNFAMTRLVAGWATAFSPANFFLSATDGRDVTVTVTVPGAAGPADQDVATVQVAEATMIATDTSVLTTTISGSAADWEKLVYVNGTVTDAVPINVIAGDAVTIVDRVWVTYTVPVTFTLVETWTSSLELTGWMSTTGSIVSSTDSLTWMAMGVATNTWHVLTKTFDVTGTVAFGYVTETLDVEGAASQLPDQTLIFRNTGVCIPVSIDDLISDSPVELGDPMNFVAMVSGDTPITYSWDFDDDGTFEQTGVGLDTPSHTYGATGDYTVTLVVTNACGADNLSIGVTVSPPPEPDWDKEVYINGVFTDTFPAPVLIGDVIEVVDWVLITYTGNVTFTLVETWTDSLDLQGWISDTGSVVTSANSLTWAVEDVAPDAWYAITKTFLVTGTCTMNYITETLDVEDGAPVAPWVLTFVHGCEPVTSVDFDWLPTDPEPGDVVTFTASSLPSYATMPITYSWDISGLITLNGNPVYYTFPTSDTYTVTVSASNPCCGPAVSETYGVAVSGTTVFTPSYGLLLEPPTDISSGDPGSDVIYHLWITNTGNVADLFNLVPTGNGWATDVTPPSVNLPPSGTQQITVTVTVAGSALCGDSDVVTITATSQLSPTVNSSSVLTTAVNTVYDVAVDPSTDTQAGDPTEMVTYTLQVTNTGNCTDTFNISKSGDVWTTVLSTDTVGPLAAGAGAGVIVTVTVTDTVNCSEFDAVTVNVTSTFASDSSVLTTTVVPSYSVTIEPPMDSGIAAPGETVTYTLRVTNTGGCNGDFAMTRLAPGWATAFAPNNFLLDAKDGRDVTVTVTIPLAAGSGAQDVATVQVEEAVSLEADTSVLTTTVSGPEPDWEKLVFVNGTPANIALPVIVSTGDTVEVVDRVWMTYTTPITFSLMETWTGSLDLTGWISTTGSAISSTNSLTWTASGAAANAWHVFTKTFDVLAGTADTITESLWVEGAAPQADQVVQFNHCTPVSITGLTSDSPVTLGEVMHFTATVGGSGAINYTWDFDDAGAGTGNGLTTANPVYTYTAPGVYTVTLDVTNACGADSDFITVTVSGGVELYAQPVVTSVGGAAFHNLVVTNTGVNTNTFTFTHAGNTWVPGPAIPPVAFSTDVVTVGAGLTETVYMTVAIPYSAAPFETDTVTVTVTPLTGDPVSMLLATNTGCRFNFTPDGIVDFDDALIELGQFGVLDDPYYDLVHNGVVDFDDVLLVLGRYGDLCP